MNLLYVANIRMPTEKAHGAQIMKMCEAFARAGTDVELLVTDRTNAITDDPFTYYGVKKEFPLTRIPVLDTVAYGKLGFLVESFSFAFAAVRRIRAVPHDLVYGRDELVLWLLGTLGVRNIVWESHTGSWNFAARSLAKTAKKLVVISAGLKEFYVERGVRAEKIIVAHDGIDLAGFGEVSKEDARRALGLPEGKPIALYAGSLGGWKGTDTFFTAAVLLPETIQAAVIGGSADEVAKLAPLHPRVRFLGYRPYRELSRHLAAANVLVLPNTGKDAVSARFTSPLKLFAYMAANRPIVASDLPSVREVLDPTCAHLVAPDDAVALASGIREALADGDAKAATARAAVEGYSWDARATRVLAAL